MIYEYKCEPCYTIWELVLSMKEDIPKEVVCENCGRPAKRVFSVPGVVFKGEGWSSKDFKRQEEDEKAFTKARIARRLKASGAVPTDAILKMEDVDPSKFHGDLSKKELDEKRCDYQGRKPSK